MKQQYQKRIYGNSVPDSWYDTDWTVNEIRQKAQELVQNTYDDDTSIDLFLHDSLSISGNRIC
ncbi:hypothetical protein FACS1894172_02850 [Spirochaetia bacterium]|nr:hypothetical protein FACS1894164_18570 [Spirochaetia bacterium]GHU30175.1 hypothetical protein FACS1894172_02850 [Spirochaetia bacterium]